MKSHSNVVATNGCFDVLHYGHVCYLEQARQLGDCLVVGLNSDASVKRIKGNGRPINPESHRAYVLAALRSVDYVVSFPHPTAMEFLQVLRPDIYVKGGDYDIDNINQTERRFVESYGGTVKVLTGIPGLSSSKIIKKWQKAGA